MAKGIPARLTAAEGRRFALTLAGAFGALAGLVWWRGHARVASVLAVIAVVLLLAGLLVPGRLRPVYSAWMGLAAALSRVTTPVFMGLVYFVVLTPAGVMMRRVRGNPLKRSRRKGSFWVTRPQDTRRRTDLRHQF